MKKLNSRKFKHGSLATVLTIGVIAAVVIVNVIATLLLDRFPLSVDLTDNKVYDLSAESLDYLKQVNTDVTITVLVDENTFSTANEYYTQAYNLMKKCAQNSAHVKLEFKDLLKNPGIQQTYPDESLQQGNIIIGRDDDVNRYKVITADDLFETSVNYSTYQYEVTGSNAEQALIRAIVSVTDDHPTKVGIVSGHNEQDLSGLTSLLTDNTYTTEDVSLVTGQVASDIDILLIAAPMSDFSDNEIATLDRFLQNDGAYGKNVVYIADPTQPVLANLSTYLSDWGIQVDPGIVIETDSSMMYTQSNLFLLANAKETTFTENMKNINNYLFVPYASPITALFAEKEYYKTENLLSSTATSALTTVENYADFQPKDTDLKAFTLGVGSVYQPKEAEKGSKVIALGSAYMLDNAMLQASDVANGEFATSLFNNLVGKTDMIQLSAKTVGGGTLGISQSQANIISVIFVAVVPICVVVAGVIVWLRRRNR